MNKNIKLTENKFDPKTLNPFDKVLVRDSYDYNWVCDIFSNIIGDSFEYKYSRFNKRGIYKT